MVTLRTNRTGANCKRQRQVKWRWTLAEDNLLKKLVERHGPGNWDFISDHLQRRSGKSCRLRWINQLNPEVDKSQFSDEERQRLLDLHGKFGNRWSIIVSHFPGRTDNQVKNQYHLLVGNKYKKASSHPSSTPLTRGSKGSPLRGRLPTVSIGLQFSKSTFQGNNNSLSGMSMSERVPTLDGGFSSVFGMKCFSGVHMYQNWGMMSLGDSVSDATSAAVQESCPVPQLQQGVGPTGYQFFDFMGVGSSE